MVLCMIWSVGKVQRIMKLEGSKIPQLFVYVNEAGRSGGEGGTLLATELQWM